MDSGSDFESTTVTANEVEAYLTDKFLTLEELAARAGVAPLRILELVAMKCIPPHSYEVTGEATVTSTFGSYRLPTAARTYYHPSVADCIKRAEALAERYDLAEVARRMKANFGEDLKTAIKGRPAPPSLGLEQAWALVLDGTWGICLKDMNALSMVEKELARALIRDLVQPEPGHCLSPQDRSHLQAAVTQYLDVASPFAPHEYPESSRRLEVHAAVEKYLLESAA